MTCASCGRKGLWDGQIRWHGDQPRWHCVTCLPAGGGLADPPEVGWYWPCVAGLLCLAVVALGLYLNK